MRDSERSKAVGGIERHLADACFVGRGWRSAYLQLAERNERRLPRDGGVANRRAVFVDEKLQAKLPLDGTFRQPVHDILAQIVLARTVRRGARRARLVRVKRVLDRGRAQLHDRTPVALGSEAFDRVDLRFARDDEGELYISTKADGKIYRLKGQETVTSQ